MAKVTGIEYVIGIEGEGTVVVSPHSDDAAFSTGALLSARFFPSPVVLITIFSRSGFHSQNSHDDPEFVSKIRKEEDRQFARAIDAEYCPLGFEDALIRESIKDPQSVFHWTTPNLKYLDQLKEGISNVVAEYADFCIVGPAGIGNHIDHVLVFKALASLDSRNVYIYADQPYSGLNPRQPSIDIIPLPKVAFATGSDWVIDRKKKFVDYYKSQPASKRMLSILNAASRHDKIEKLWRLP